MARGDLVFLDTETTGLNHRTEQLVELTYASLDSEPVTLYFGLTEVPEFIDNFIKFTERGLSGRISSMARFDEFKKFTEGKTMVAANPAFDKAFLEEAGLFNFHYRMLDLETYAAKAFGLDYVPSMNEIYSMLTAVGHEMTQPDHTSLNDVLALREAFLILEKM